VSELSELTLVVVVMTTDFVLVVFGRLTTADVLWESLASLGVDVG